MNIRILFYSIVAFLVLSCSNEEQNPGDVSLTTKENITLKAGTTNTTVLFFQKENNVYSYNRTVMVDVSTTVNLNYGDYKCLFYKYAGDSIKRLPETISAANSIEDFEFNALPDASMPSIDNYVLPVNELWLPENIGDANISYTIPTVTTIQNTLARAVSQVVVHFKKVTSDGDTISIVSDPAGTLQNLGELTLDISGVSTTWDITGPSGNGKTFFQTEQAASNEDGSISYYGPFVFPSEVNATSVNLKFETIEESVLPSIAERTIQGSLERNKKLEITLVLKEGGSVDPVDGELDIEVEVVEMEDNSDGGDNGIWE